MACPFFYPIALLDSSCWASAPRLPLGDAYRGECRAVLAPFEPDDARARNTCNVGYARGSCECFPQDAEADAVRFHVAADSGDRIRIQYIFEKDCWPARHGVFEYSVSARQMIGDDADEILRIQAGMFLESYIRRRDETNSKAAAR